MFVVSFGCCGASLSKTTETVENRDCCTKGEKTWHRTTVLSVVAGCFSGVLKSAQGLLSVPVVAMVRLLSRVPVCESTGENKVIETTIDDLNSEILPY